MLINKLLSESMFKINRENFGIPVFFLVKTEEDMIRMVNTVTEDLDDFYELFHDYIDHEFNMVEDEEYVVQHTLKQMHDVIYSSVNDIQILEKYPAVYIPKGTIKFKMSFDEPLVFFILNSSGFDRFGSTSSQIVSHCKLKDLAEFGLAVSEPTYFENS